MGSEMCIRDRLFTRATPSPPLPRRARTRLARRYVGNTHFAGDDSKTFDGLVAIDAEGHVVWMYHLSLLESWDFLPGGDVVLQANAQGGFEVNTSLRETAVAGGDGRGVRRWRANSQMQQISPLGELRTQFVSACTGDPTNYNQLTHECRVDQSNPRNDVYTTRMKVRHLPGTSLLMRTTPTDDDEETWDYWYGVEVVRWNRVDLSLIHI